MTTVIQLEAWLDFQKAAETADYKLYKLYGHSGWPPSVKLYAVSPLYIVTYYTTPYELTRRKVGAVKVRHHYGVHDEELQLRRYEYTFGFKGDWLFFGGEVYKLVDEDDRKRVRESWAKFTDGLTRHLEKMGYVPGEAWSGEVAEVYSE